jgi:hypothetical protein
MFEQLQQQMRALIVDVDVGQIPIGHGRREWFGTKLKLLEYVFQPIDTDLIHWDRNVDFDFDCTCACLRCLGATDRQGVSC